MRRYLYLFLAFVIFVGFTGCTKYAKEEHLKKLDETKAAALAAEKELQMKNSERSNWEQKVAQKEMEKDSKQSEKEEVAKKVNK